MGLIRLLPWIILIVIALFFFSRKKKEREREAMEEELEKMRRQLAESRRAAASGSASPEEMVRCERCGTFFPKKEGYVKSGRLYCSKECARKDS